LLALPLASLAKKIAL